MAIAADSQHAEVNMTVAQAPSRRPEAQWPHPLCDAVGHQWLGRAGHLALKLLRLHQLAL